MSNNKEIKIKDSASFEIECEAKTDPEKIKKHLTKSKLL